MGCFDSLLISNDFGLLFLGSVDLQCAHTLYQDLKTAQAHLVLINDLHIMYLVTPYDLAKQMKPVGSVFYNVVRNVFINYHLWTLQVQFTILDKKIEFL